jgi:hypothetical protein
MWKNRSQFAVIRIKLMTYETGFASRFREWLRRSDEGQKNPGGPASMPTR